MRFSVRVYRLLLKLYPATFRERYEAALERQFKDEYAEVTGRSQLGVLWLRTLLDFARSMPLQVAQEIGQDSRHALRTWRRSPFQALSILAVLAIAVGANTGVYSILDALLLRSLPFAEPHRLAVLDRGAPVPVFNRNAFYDWSQRSQYLENSTVYSSYFVNLDAGRSTGRARLTETSRTFFPMLGVRPLLGRGFDADDETPGRDPVAIIAHGLWLQQFGGDHRVIGSVVRLNGVPLTIVGVAPPGFDYPTKTQIWSSTVWEFMRIPKTGVTFWSVVGRLRPELSWRQAREAFAVDMRALFPPGHTPSQPPVLTPLRESLAGPVRQASFVLMGGTALLLLLACANIANVLLARTLARATEMKVRQALGASRARLVQQLLTEALLMALIAGVTGLTVAWWSTGLAALAQPAPLESQAYAVLDWRVLGFTAVMVAAIGVIFGVGPAVYAVRAGFAGASRVATPSVVHRRASGLLVAAQITITIVLLTGSLALGRTFVALLRVDSGFDVTSLVSVRASFAGAGYTEKGRARVYAEEGIRRISEIPGVVSASATELLPLAIGAHGLFGYTVDGTGPELPATVVPIAHQYFQTLGTRVLAGREFVAADLSSSEPIAIVNEELARRIGSDPRSFIGRRLVESGGSRLIVGVVQGIRDGGPSYTPQPQIFLPSRTPLALTFVARVAGDARDHLALIRDAVAVVDPKVTVFDAKTMEQRLEETLARPKVYATSVVFFGGLALLLAIVGLHGVVAHAVVRRTREMAIRLALGTTPMRLRGRVLGQTVAWVLLGAIPGIAVALSAGGYVRNLIPDADASLVTTCALVSVGTVTLAAAASWWASHRVSRLEIMSILRLDTGD